MNPVKSMFLQNRTGCNLGHGLSQVHDFKSSNLKNFDLGNSIAIESKSLVKLQICRQCGNLEFVFCVLKII
jgi:hypothetical protein